MKVSIPVGCGTEPKIFTKSHAVPHNETWFRLTRQMAGQYVCNASSLLRNLATVLQWYIFGNTSELSSGRDQFDTFKKQSLI